jgi:hypothetical protein
MAKLGNLILRPIQGLMTIVKIRADLRQQLLLEKRLKHQSIVTGATIDGRQISRNRQQRNSAGPEDRG